MNKLVFGQNDLDKVVYAYAKDGNVLCLRNNEWIEVPSCYWIVSSKCLGNYGWKRLSGGLHYKYIYMTGDWKEINEIKKRYYKHQCLYTVSNMRENAMMFAGVTYYKNMEPAEVSAVFFDIEATTLKHTHEAKVLLISSLYCHNNVVEKKLFAIDEYKDEKAMLLDWMAWVRVKNPVILSGHAVLIYDLPYIKFRCDVLGIKLELGRNGEEVRFGDRSMRFRIDGTRDIHYFDAKVFGREIVDTLFLSYKYDVYKREYLTYGLKAIIKYEGLEQEGRQHYDASKIKDNWQNLEEWAKIKAYCLDDSNDAKKLFYLMIPAYFYLSQMLSRPFQYVMTSASGSQINAMLVRSYLNDLHSLPDKTPAQKYEGAISQGNPGFYKNCFKVDVAAMYPSLMLEYRINDWDKEPKGYILQILEYLTAERLQYKKMFKETGNKTFKAIEQAFKIIINSFYGFLGAEGLLFNSPKSAMFVTNKGRTILKIAIEWVVKNNYTLVNCDTDSVMIMRSDKGVFNTIEMEHIIQQLNSLCPLRIRWEDDGIYMKVLILRVKNYVLVKSNGSVIKRGSAVKAPMKEPALKQLTDGLIDILLEDE